MGKFVTAALSGPLTIGFCTAAFATTPDRLNGEISAVRPDALEITTYSGKKVELSLGPDTRFASVLPASLSGINGGEFVGIATTGPENHLTAPEVVIFPASMRGTGEGHYAWSLPAEVANEDLHRTGAAAGAPPVQGTMTNGTVAGPSTASSAMQGLVRSHCWRARTGMFPFGSDT